MHIDRANQIPMPTETAAFAVPLSSSGLVAMPTYRTLAAGPSLAASEALDVSLFRFMGEIVDIFAVLPLRHALIMMPAGILLAYPMRITDKERAHLLRFAKVDHLARRLMPQITDTPLQATTHPVPGPLQFPPAARVFLTACLLSCELAMPDVALPFEATNATP